MANYSLGEAVLGTSVDLKGLQGGMRQAEGESRSAWDRIGGIAEKALGFFTGTLLTRGFDALVGAAQSVGDAMLNEAPRVEGLRKSFDNLATSAGYSSDEILASLRSASKGMVTDVDLMESFNKSMLLVGEGMATKLPKLLEIAQASAAATGQDVGFMLDSLVTGIGRGSPMILDNLGLTINLQDAYASYAKTLGITTGEMTKAQQQEALLNAVVASGDEFIARLGDNTGGAAMTLAQLKVQFENTRMELATALLPALSALLPVLLSLAQQFGPPLIAWLTEAGKWLGVNLPIAIQALQTWWATAWPQISATLQAAWAIIGPALSQAATWLGTNLPLALQTLQLWWPQIQSSATQVGTIMTTVVIPAVQSLATWFTTSLIPALQAVWNYFSVNILPIYQMVADASMTILGTAVTVLATTWETVLLPALQAVWGFVQTSLLPLLESLGNVVGTVLDVALKALAGTWQNVIIPAVDAAAKAINTNIKPALESVANTVLPPLKSALEGISGAIEGVIRWLNDMATKLAAISLPDWMTPGSPTPWEIGLVGVSQAMQKLSGQALPQLEAQLQIGATPITAMASAPGAEGLMGAGVTINFNGALTVDSPQRVRELADEISRILGRELLMRSG